MSGHPRMYELLTEAAELHTLKNGDYAGGGRALGNFERRAVILGLYPGLDLSDPATVAMVDILKQLDAALHLKSTKRAGNVEGIPSRLKDVAGYAYIACILDEERQG